ncbi:MAG: hypothetical protein ABIH35_02090 [Patescibacteria group bacterium]
MTSPETEKGSTEIVPEFSELLEGLSKLFEEAADLEKNVLLYEEGLDDDYSDPALVDQLLGKAMEINKLITPFFETTKPETEIAKLLTLLSLEINRLLAELYILEIQGRTRNKVGTLLLGTSVKIIQARKETAKKLIQLAQEFNENISKLIDPEPR